MPTLTAPMLNGPMCETPPMPKKAQPRREPPKADKDQHSVGIRFPIDMYAKLETFAGKEDRSIAYMVKRAVREMLERNGFPTDSAESDE